MFCATLRQKPPGDLPVVCFVGPVDPTPEPGELFLVTFGLLVRILEFGKILNLLWVQIMGGLDCTVIDPA